jgi:hypothetical protein
MTAPYGRGSETPHLRVTKAAFKSSPRLVEAYLQLRIQIAAMNQLIRSHIVETDEDLNNVSIASFHPSDLLVLKLLNGPKAIPTPQD